MLRCYPSGMDLGIPGGLFRDILKTANQHLDDGRIFGLRARLSRGMGGRGKTTMSPKYLAVYRKDEIMQRKLAVAL